MMLFYVFEKELKIQSYLNINNITLINIEEVEILRYRIRLPPICLGIFCKCTPLTLNISKTKNATLLMKLSKII